jgi:hypothetical protein
MTADSGLPLDAASVRMASASSSPARNVNRSLSLLMRVLSDKRPRSQPPVDRQPGLPPIAAELRKRLAILEKSA